MMIPLFFNPKKKLYYFEGEETCNSCGNIIEKQIIFNTQWRRKKEPILKFYCLNCHQKIKDYGGEVTENFIATIVNSIPRETYPIFIFPPTLVNYKGESVFSAVFIKNSEAEIIDHTRLAGRPDPNNNLIALEIKKNKELLEKRDKELGQSPFLLKDMRLDEENHNRDKKYGHGKYKKIYQKEIPKDNLDIDKFLDGVKNSKPLIEQEERRQLT